MRKNNSFTDYGENTDWKHKNILIESMMSKKIAYWKKLNIISDAGDSRGK